MLNHDRTTKAIVTFGPLSKGGWRMEEVQVRTPEANELVVEMVASGICHTDLHFGNVEEGPGSFYPRVLGHEGEIRTTFHSSWSDLSWGLTARCD